MNFYSCPLFYYLENKNQKHKMYIHIKSECLEEAQ